VSTRATDPEPSTAGEPAGDRLLELIAERAGADRAEAVRAFAQAYLRRLAVDGVAEEELASEVLGAFALAAERGTAPAAVRAFNPTLAEHGYAPAGSVLETNTDDLPFLVDSVTGALHAAALAARPPGSSTVASGP